PSGPSVLLPSSQPAVSLQTWSAIGAIRDCAKNPELIGALQFVGLMPPRLNSRTWRATAGRFCSLSPRPFIRDPALRKRIAILRLALRAEPLLSSRRAIFIGFAASALGTPYRWGGMSATGYDCSGLVFAAGKFIGVSLPRIAQAQFDAGRAPERISGRPGDLVFFGGALDDISHVGIVITPLAMIDAPNSGSFVRLEDSQWTDLVGVRNLLGD
ncbi:MAG: C40 family peptidase, partial [Actinobacteria bacterium]|nr:C40 family peptidase [Actinomycetota bacterium]